MKKLLVYLVSFAAGGLSIFAMERPEPAPASAQQGQVEPIQALGGPQLPVVPANNQVPPPQQADMRPALDAQSDNFDAAYFDKEKGEHERKNAIREAQYQQELQDIRIRQGRASSEQERHQLLEIERARIVAHGAENVQLSANGAEWFRGRGMAIKNAGMVERTRIWAQALRDPKVAGVLGLSATLVFAGWHGTKVAGDALGQWLQIPPLAQKTSIKSFGQKFIHYFYPPREEKSTLDDVILEPHLAERVRSLTASIRNTAMNDGYFRHYLLYGPPGTGKTLLAMSMAQDSGLEFIYFAASKLELYSIEEGTKQLVHLFEYAKRYPKKCMIIMDEAEVLLGKREHMSDKTHKLLSVLLAYTGTESKDVMLMAITNKPGNFDGASLNRLGEKIKIGEPGVAERRRLLEKYLEKHVISATKPGVDTRSWMSKLLYKAPERKLLVIEEGLCDPSVIDDIAQKLDGFVGRDISDLCLAIRGAADATSMRALTKELVYRELEIKCTQKQAELHNFVEPGPVKG